MRRPEVQAAADTVARGASAPRWERAACRSADPRVFFPEDEHGEPDEDGAKAQVARGICGRCPVREPCLQHALGAAMPVGIWGGLSTRERELPDRRGAA